jgi:transposase InsO family protein
MVVMDQFTRRIIGFAVHPGDVDGISLCRMFNIIIAGISPPRYLSTDHDPLFGYHRWQANLRVLDVDEIKSIAGVPVSHPFIERLTGSVRREFLDHILFWNAGDLESKLGEFQKYYNQKRVHASTHRLMEIRRTRWLEGPRLSVRRLMISNGNRIAVVWSNFQSLHER